MTASRRPRALALAVLAAALTAGTTAGMAAGGAPAGDSAVAINTKDGSSVFRLAFHIRRLTADVVNTQNAAVAYASCTACQTVAISIEVLLIAGTPTQFTPTNIAAAINQNCTLCDTVALAYQFAVGLGTRLRLTPAGRQEIADLRRQLHELRNSGLTGVEIAQRVDAITKRLSEVLATELVGVAPRDGSGDSEASAGSGAQTAGDTTTTGTAPQATSTTPVGTPSGATTDTTPTTSTAPTPGTSTSTTPTTSTTSTTPTP